MEKEKHENHMTIQEMRKLLGLSQDGFSKKYGIPKRTIENWESGKRNAPDYVISLLERAVLEDYKNEVMPFDMAIQRSFADTSDQGIIDNRFL